MLTDFNFKGTDTLSYTVSRLSCRFADPASFVAAKGYLLDEFVSFILTIAVLYSQMQLQQKLLIFHTGR